MEIWQRIINPHRGDGLQTGPAHHHTGPCLLGEHPLGNEIAFSMGLVRDQRKVDGPWLVAGPVSEAVCRYLQGRFRRIVLSVQTEGRPTAGQGGGGCCCCYILLLGIFDRLQSRWPFH